MTSRDVPESLPPKPLTLAPIAPQGAHWIWPDIFRGLAALLVCSGHLRGALFMDYAETRSSTLGARLFYLSTALGHQSVMIFFVLSGFLVGGSVVRAGSGLSISDYATARLSRLWTVLLPALLLTLACDLLLQRIAPAVLDGALSGKWGSTPTPGSHSLAPWTFLANLAFLQTLVAPVYGSNSPLWSLAYEFWYYALFPLVVFSLARGTQRTRGWRLAAGVLALALVFLAPARMIVGFGIWLMGAGVWCLNQAPRRWLGHPSAAFAAAALFAASLLVSVARPALFVYDAIGDTVIGLCFACLLASLLQQRRQPTLTGRLGKPLRFLSDVSYSLYAVHFPCVLLLGVAWETTQTQWRPSADTLARFGLSLIALCAWAYLVWSVTERHTSSVRRWMRATWPSGRARAGGEYL